MNEKIFDQELILIWMAKITAFPEKIILRKK